MINATKTKYNKAPRASAGAQKWCAHPYFPQKSRTSSSLPFSLVNTLTCALLAPLPLFILSHHLPSSPSLSHLSLYLQTNSVLYTLTPFAPDPSRLNAYLQRPRLDMTVWNHAKSCIDHLREKKLCIAIADCEGAIPLDHVDLTRPTAFVLGNELTGISQQVCEGGREKKSERESVCVYVMHKFPDVLTNFTCM